MHTMEAMTEKAFGREMILTKKEVKPFAKRNNIAGLINFIGHVSILAITGYLLFLSLGTWWIVPTMIAHSIVMAFLFAPVHECSHGTPFRSRWLNETVYWIVCLIYMVPPTFFRYAHATHHTYTQIRGMDPDMLPKNMTMGQYVYYVSTIEFWIRGLKWFLMHPFGKIDPAQKYYIPNSEIPRATHEARIIVIIYGLIAVAAIYFQSWVPMIYWVIPRLVGEPFMRWIRVAEHGGCPETGDLRENTRTTKASSLMYFLFWNMPYHSEHHLCPMVPFHALGSLHEKVKDKLHPVGESYPKVHGEVLKEINGWGDAKPGGLAG